MKKQIHAHGFAIRCGGSIMPACPGNKKPFDGKPASRKIHKNLLALCIRSDTIGSMNSFISTDAFDNWLASLTDKVGKARILQRLDSAMLGNFGDCEPVGEGVSEMRIHYGPGYRVYFTRQGTVVYLLLLGGDKSSQKRDIKLAKKLLAELGKE